MRMSKRQRNALLKKAQKPQEQLFKIQRLVKGGPDEGTWEGSGNGWHPLSVQNERLSELQSQEPDAKFRIVPVGTGSLTMDTEAHMIINQEDPSSSLQLNDHVIAAMKGSDDE